MTSLNRGARLPDMKNETLKDDSPAELARVIAASHGTDWIQTAVKYLDYALCREPLIRLKEVWSMNNTQCAKMFRVTRPTIVKWLKTRPPPRMALLVSLVGDVSELLQAHLDRERIPAIVRTGYEFTEGKTLMQLGGEGRYFDMLEAARMVVGLTDSSK